tara:strand:- start:281 stop:2647 length:2367 start_codon:yes stop_codon:yes gene_type:complete
MAVTGKGGLQYDISIVRTDGTTEVGLMLDEANGRKKYERVTDPTLAQQFFTGDPSYGRTEPEKLLAMTQSSYMAGFGQEFHDGTSPNDKRYYTSTGCDARFEDNVILGPKATAVALTDVTLTVTDGGMETWTNSTTLTHWTEVVAGGTDLERESSIKYAGSYSAKLDDYDVGDYIYQDMIADVAATASWRRGTPVTVRCWCYAEDVSDVGGTLTIDDGVGSTSSDNMTSDEEWTELVVTHVLDSSATRLRIKLYGDSSSGSGAAIYFDAVECTSPEAGNPVAFAEFNSEWYMAYGDTLSKLSATGDGWTLVYSFFSTTITDLEPFADGNLYICFGSTASKYYYMNTSEAFTISTLADGYAEHMANVGGVMHKSVLPNEIKKATDPTNAGSWGSAITVGASYTNITDVIAEQSTVYIGKEDMAYYLDGSDNDIPLADDIHALIKSTNGKNMMAWHRNVYIPLGDSSLGEYTTDGTWTWRSPTRFSTNLANFAGNIQALAADEEYIFAIIDNSTKVEVVAGQVRTVNGSTLWVWHPIQEFTLAGAEVAGVTSIYKKRLWIASTSASDSVYYIPLTTKYGDVTGDSDVKFQTGGYIITPWLHSNLKSDSKAYHSLTLATEGCDSNNYVTVDYQTYFTALAGSWTNLGNFTTSPSQTRYFTNVTGTMIRFRFTLVTNSTSTTPKLTNFDVRGIWRPTKRRLIFCTVRLGDGVVNKAGAPSEGYQSMKDAIEEAVNQAKPNTFYDIDSVSADGTHTSKSVNLLHAREFDVRMGKDQNKPESKYELVFEEIVTS